MNIFRNIWCVYPGHSVPQHEDDRVGPPADQEGHGDDRHDESHPPVVARLGPGPPRHQLLLGRVLVELEEDEGEGGDHDHGGHDEHADGGVPHPGVLDIMV